MKKFLIIMFGIVVLAGIGASIYVSTIDWNQHKDGIAKQLQEITGKKFVLNGPVNMTIFPMPSLNASNVQVYSNVNQDAEHPLMTIDNVVAKLSFSALLGGNFDVKMMTLVKPSIYLERKGKDINWLDHAQTNAQAEFKDIKIALDSVLLQDATMKIVDEEYEVEAVLNNLNAEIIADSLEGPYRIDGSYTKGNNPEGFAISIGNISESFATNLNFVLSQPSSETYVRFDGTFLLSNEALNGNLIIESKKFKDFYDSITPFKKIPTYWNQPLEASMELKVNKTLAELSKVIVKYGNSAGAGNISLPLKNKSYIIGEEQDDTPRELNIKFEMTDLDLDPIVSTLKDFIGTQLQDNVIYSPEIPFDMVLDLSAIKASYNNQTIKDFGISIKLNENVWQIEKVKGSYPGESEIKMTGRFFPVEDVLSYTMSVDFQTAALKKFLEWINLPVTTVANSTYQKANLKAVVVGDTKAVQVSPFTLAVDNTILTGQLGVKRGQPTHYALELATDSIILDNYIPKVLEGKDDYVSVLKDLWNKSVWLQNIDLDLNLKAGLLIYEKTSFDKVVLKASAQKGILDIETMSIGEFLKSNLKLSGEIKGFGQTMQFSNLTYDINVADFMPLMNKLNITPPSWNLKYFQPFSSAGVASLNNDRLWMKINNKGGDSELSYNGRVEIENEYSLNGDIQVRTLDASEFLKSLPLSYNAQDAKLGRLWFKSRVVGNADKFQLSDMSFSIGSNTFQGVFGVDKTRTIPYIAADLQINRLEPEKFLSKGDKVTQFSVDKASVKGSVWAKPNLSEVPFDIESLKKMTFLSNLSIGELLLDDKLFKNVKVQIENKNNELAFRDFQSNYNDGSINGGLIFKYIEKPRLNGDLHITNQSVHNLGWQGNAYGLSSGTAEINIDMNTSALFPRDILDNFSGTVSVNVDAPVFKGIELSAVSEDLKERKESEGFASVLQKSLQRGETAFNKFSGHLNFKDGEWLIDRAWFKSDLASMDISGTGNLKDWTMDELFTVQLSDPQNINPFSFTLKGSIPNPELEANASLIMKVYDDHQAQVEAVAKAKQEAHDRALRKKVDAQKVVLQNSRKEFDEFVNSVYQPLKAKINAKKYQRIYIALDEQIEKQYKAFDEANLLLLEKNLKDEYPVQLAQVSANAKKLQETVGTEMKNLNRQDMIDIITQNYNDIKKENEKEEKVVKDSLVKHDEHLLRLNNIETEYRFQTDKMYNQLLDSINERMKTYDSIVQHVERYGKIVQEETDLTLLEQYITESSTMLEKAKEQRVFLADDINRYLTYVDEKLKVEEKVFADKKAAEEKAKKIEEDIGTITASNKGKAPTLIKAIEDIEQDDKSEQKSEKGTEETEAMEVNLLGDDPAVKASGTISKK